MDGKAARIIPPTVVLRVYSSTVLAASVCRIPSCSVGSLRSAGSVASLLLSVGYPPHHVPPIGVFIDSRPMTRLGLEPRTY